MKKKQIIGKLSYDGTVQYHKRPALETPRLLISNLLQGCIIRRVWCRHKNRHVDEWNRIDGPELKPQCMVNRYLTAEPRTPSRERIGLSIYGYGKTGYLYAF